MAGHTVEIYGFLFAWSEFGQNKAESMEVLRYGLVIKMLSIRSIRVTDRILNSVDYAPVPRIKIPIFILLSALCAPSGD